MSSSVSASVSAYEFTFEFFVLTLALSLVFAVCYRCTLHRVYGIACLTSLWYAISISFTIYNKWLLTAYRGGGATFAMTNTSIHLVVRLVFSQVWHCLLVSPPPPPPAPPVQVQVQVLTPSYESLSLPENDQNHTVNQSQPETDHSTTSSTSTTLFLVAIVGMTTAMDISFSNEGIEDISISLYTIIKATVCLWTFFWGCVFGIEVFTCAKLSLLTLMTVGLGMAVVSSNIFASTAIRGIAFCLAASASGGLRWVAVQLLCLRDPSCRHNAMKMLYKISPSSALAMLPLIVLYEPFVFTRYAALPWRLLIEILGFIVLGGAISCLLILVEISLVIETSSLTLSILGQVKEVLQIALSIVAFHDRLTWQSAAGIAVSLLSAEGYRQVQHRDRELRENASSAPAAISSDSIHISDSRNMEVELGTVKQQQRQQRTLADEELDREQLEPLWTTSSINGAQNSSNEAAITTLSES